MVDCMLVASKGETVLNLGAPAQRNMFAKHASENVYIPGRLVTAAKWTGSRDYGAGHNMVANYTKQGGTVIIVGDSQLEVAVGAMALRCPVYMIVKADKSVLCEEVLTRAQKAFESFIPCCFPAELAALTVGALLAITDQSKGYDWDLDGLTGLAAEYPSIDEVRKCSTSYTLADGTEALGIVMPEEAGAVYVKPAGINIEGDDFGLGTFAAKDHKEGATLMSITGFYFPKDLGVFYLQTLLRQHGPVCAPADDTLLSRCSLYPFKYHHKSMQNIDFHMAKTAASYINSRDCPKGGIMDDNVGFVVVFEDDKKVRIDVQALCDISKVAYPLLPSSFAFMIA